MIASESKVQLSAQVPADELGRRRQAACLGLAALGAQALVTTRPENVQYLTGYAVRGDVRPVIAVLLETGELFMIAAGQYGQSIERDVPGVRLEIYGPPVAAPSEWILPDGVVQFAPAAFERLRQVIVKTGVEKVALDGLNATYPPTTRLEAALSETELVDGSALIWQLRRKKSPWEIDRLRDAARSVEAAFDLVVPQLRPGMTELDIQRRMSIAILETGLGLVFVTARVVGDGVEIVGRPTERPWEMGKLLYIDAGASSAGYISDFCRTFVTGSPSAGQAAAYQRVVNARDAVLAAFQPGITAGELASVMCDVLGAGPEQVAGRYGHGLGFGLEPPSLNPADPTVMEDGTVFCLEPALVVDGTYYTLEEEYVVRSTGLELLSPAAPRELIKL